MDLSTDLIAFAGRLADKAGAVALRYFRQSFDIDDKADSSPVTIADRTAEAEMRQAIGAAFPHHGIYGEEFGVERADAEYVWVLDPIDGTKAFITGNPQFGNLIALLHHGRPVVGVINMPAQRERWVGAAGHGARFFDYRGQESAQVRACPDLGKATLRSTSLDMFTGESSTAFQRLRSLVNRTLYGGDCFSYGQLASGWLDLVIEANLQPYDYLPLAAVIEGAGGIITDWSGAPLTLKSDGRVLAAGDRRCHKSAQALLQGAA